MEKIFKSKESCKIPIPHKIIHYANNDYIVLLSEYDDTCICVTGNTIVCVVLDEQVFLTELYKPNLVARTKLFNPFTLQIMNRKDVFKDLSSDDQRFYYELFEETDKLKAYVEKNKVSERILRNLHELIIEIQEVSENTDLKNDMINKKMNELTDEQYSLSYLTGVKKSGRESTLFTFCRDVYLHG